MASKTPYIRMANHPLFDNIMLLHEKIDKLKRHHNNLIYFYQVHLQQLDEYKDISPNYADILQGSRFHSRLKKLESKIKILTSELDSLHKSLLDAQSNLFDALHSVQLSPEEFDALYHRYILGEPIRVIANNMGHSLAGFVLIRNSATVKFVSQFKH